MIQENDTAEVIVVGGGVIGLSVSRAVARRGRQKLRRSDEVRKVVAVSESTSEPRHPCLVPPACR